MSDIQSEIINKISQTKKYQRLSPDVIHVAVLEAARRYTNPHEIDRKARNILHQIWGAYYYNPPNFVKVTDTLKNELAQGKNLKTSIAPFLALHSSTRERIPYLDDFYTQIFSHTGTPTSIIDHACGLNPLTFPWMNLPPSTTYAAYDIDAKEIEFVSTILKTHAPYSATAEQLSISQSSRKSAQVAFFFKCITCLDHLQKEVGIQALEQQVCSYAVVTFAIKSIKGYEKGMKEFYSQKFEQYLHARDQKYHKIVFPTELVYVVKK